MLLWICALEWGKQVKVYLLRLCKWIDVVFNLSSHVVRLDIIFSLFYKWIYVEVVTNKTWFLHDSMFICVRQDVVISLYFLLMFFNFFHFKPTTLRRGLPIFLSISGAFTLLRIKIVDDSSNDSSAVYVGNYSRFQCFLMRKLSSF